MSLLSPCLDVVVALHVNCSGFVCAHVYACMQAYMLAEGMHQHTSNEKICEQV